MLIFSSRESGNLRKQGQNHLESTIPNARQVVGQPLDLSVPNQGQALVPFNKQYKQIENSYKLELPKNELEVIAFFKKIKAPELEAQKFYNHYQANGWKIGGKIKMEDWHASAKNWILKAAELKTEKRQSQNRDNISSNEGSNLHTIRNKNYDHPL